MDTKKIKDIIAKHINVESDNLNLNADFKNDLHLDSIDLFQIIMEAEEAYNIKLDNNQLLNIKTIGDAINIVENVQ